ncbi:MAG: PorT family protein [Bacteroidales bacterium]|nr:PorT family protein [Bacteroidales bacterium]
MKKLVTIAALLLALSVSMKVQAQLNLNIGFAPERVHSSIGGDKAIDTTYWLAGFFAGLNYKIQVTEQVGVTIGAQYRMNVRNVSKHIYEGSYFSHYVVRERQTLVDLPIMVHYDIPLGPKFSLSPFVGPMLSFAISGSTNSELTYPHNQSFNDDWYDKNSTKSRFNVYGMAGLEAIYNRINVFVGYRMGLLDLDKSDLINTRVSGAFVGIGHSF